MTHEAEQAVVGSALDSAEAYEALAGRVAVDDFADPLCRAAFGVVAGLRDAGLAADEVTVGAVLGASALWPRDVAPAPWCAAVRAVTPSATQARAYAALVRESAIARRIRQAGERIAMIGAADADTDAAARLAAVEAVVEPLLSDAVGDDFATLADIAPDAIAELMAKMDGPEGLTGQATGWRDLDALTGGLQDADLIVYAGRPSMGKTAGALNIAAHVATSAPVLFFSLEMSRKALFWRLAAALGPIDMGDILRARIDERQQATLAAAGVALRQLDLRIDDRGGISVDQLVMRTRVAARKRMPRLIVVDYLTKLRGVGDTRTAEVGYCAQRLKDLAKEMGCPVLCLAQLNRGVDSRGDARPKMSDLRDSGEIEQEADIVMFNFLDEIYDEDSPRAGILELLIEKHRNGDTGTIYLDWQGRYQRFTDRHEAVPPLQARGGGAGSKLRALAGGRGADRAAGDASSW